jgi:inorganic pyrophosphatase
MSKAAEREGVSISNLSFVISNCYHLQISPPQYDIQEHMIHPWRDVSPGEQLPQQFQSVIEIPFGSSVKYELDKESGLIRQDRVLYSAV